MAEVKTDTTLKQKLAFRSSDIKFMVSVVLVQVVVSAVSAMVCLTILSLLLFKITIFSDPPVSNAKYDEWWSELTIGESIPVFHLALAYFLFSPSVGFLLLFEIKRRIHRKRIWRMIPWVIYMFVLLFLFVHQNWYQIRILLVMFVVNIVPFGFGFHTITAHIIVSCIEKRRVAANVPKINEFIKI